MVVRSVSQPWFSIGTDVEVIDLTVLGTQYTTELILHNIQRNDQRFRTITCSNLNGLEKREYVIDVTCT